jgi:hypothetical protein
MTKEDEEQEKRSRLVWTPFQKDDQDLRKYNREIATPEMLKGINGELQHGRNAKALARLRITRRPVPGRNASCVTRPRGGTTPWHC